MARRSMWPASLYSRNRPSRSVSSSVSISTNAPLAQARSALKSASVPLPPSTRGAVRPLAGVPVENGSAATRAVNCTLLPFTTASAERSSQRPGIWNGSFLASTPASRKRSSAHSKARRFAGEPVGRPPIWSVRVCRSLTIGVSPIRAPASREAPSDWADREWANQPARAAATAAERTRVPRTPPPRSSSRRLTRGITCCIRRADRIPPGPRAACCRRAARECRRSGAGR